MSTNSLASSLATLLTPILAFHTRPRRETSVVQTRVPPVLVWGIYMVQMVEDVLIRGCLHLVPPPINTDQHTNQVSEVVIPMQFMPTRPSLQGVSHSRRWVRLT